MTPDTDDTGKTIEDLDPCNLLPFERELEPRDENVERLPNAYIGTDEITYGGNYV